MGSTQEFTSALFVLENIVPITIILFVLFVISAALSIIALVRLGRLQSLYESFLGGSSKNTIEALLLDYVGKVNKVESLYDTLSADITKIDEKTASCLQKVGMVRYNPFPDVGGNLSYALAILNERDDGILINSLYNRDGSYAYGKPVLGGHCDYTLSKEEQEALEIAMRRAPAKPVSR